MLIVGSILFALLLGLLWLIRDSPYTWLVLGFTGIVCVQTTLLVCYFMYRVRGFYSSSSIKVRLSTLPNNLDNFVDENQKAARKFNTLRNKTIFLNKYSQEAKLVRKKMKMVQKKFEEGQEAEVEAPRVNYFKATNQFLGLIELYQRILDKFSRSPAEMGNQLASLASAPMFMGHEYRFFHLEQAYPSFVSLNELNDAEKELLSSVRVPLDDKNHILWLPSWQSLKEFYNAMGKCYSKYMSEIRFSNSELISITHKKILQDQEYLLSEISILTSSISETKATLDLLQQEERTVPAERENDSQPDNAEDHIQWVYWLKKRYKEFTDLTLKIKQNQTKLKFMKQKLRYYRQNLQTFLNRYKHAFYKTQKTTFRAYFQGCYNSAAESIEQFGRCVHQLHQYQQLRPPKVNQMLDAQFPQQALLAEKKYRYQYFQRADFYLSETKMLQQAVQDLSSFLMELQQVFSGFQRQTERDIANFKEHQNKFYLKFFENVSSTLVSEKFLEEVDALIRVNGRFFESNKHQLLVLQGKILRLKQSINVEMSNLEALPAGASDVAIRERLEQLYRMLEEQVQLSNKFRQIYLTHSNRIKKSLLCQSLTMLNSRRKNIYDHINKIDSKLFSMHAASQLNTTLLGDINFDEAAVQSKSEQSEQQPDDNVHDITLSDTLVNCLNKFLFAACLEWSTSQRFKNKIQKKLYVVFNSDPPDNLSQIEVFNIQFGGPPMRIQKARSLRSQQLESLLEVNVSFPGFISLEINTSIKFFQSTIGVRAKAEIRGLNCVARVCFVPAWLGRGWFSFIGDPIVKIDIVPVLGNITMDYQTVRRYIENFLLDKLRKKVFPIKAPLRVPVSKKSNKGKRVRQRMADIRQRNNPLT